MISILVVTIGITCLVLVSAFIVDKLIDKTPDVSEPKEFVKGQKVIFDQTLEVGVITGETFRLIAGGGIEQKEIFYEVSFPDRRDHNKVMILETSLTSEVADF